MVLIHKTQYEPIVADRQWKFMENIMCPYFIYVRCALPVKNDK